MFVLLPVLLLAIMMIVMMISIRISATDRLKIGSRDWLACTITGFRGKGMGLWGRFRVCGTAAGIAGFVLGVRGSRKSGCS